MILRILGQSLLLVASALAIPSFQHDPWQEPRTSQWKKNVAENRRFLTKQGRQSLYDEFVDRQSQQELQSKNTGNRIRGGTPPKSTPNDRDLQEVNPDVGELNVLVLLIQWKNHPDRNQAVSKEDIEQMLNGEGRNELLYPGGSVKGYFDAISYGNFNINFVVSDWFLSEFTEQQFTANGSRGRTQELQQAFEPALQYLDDDFFRFKDFDTNFDREIDLTLVLHSGYDGSIGGKDCETGKMPMERISSHARSGADFLQWRSRAGYGLGAYAVAPAFRGVCNTEIDRIGTITHEMIHPFGLPEMYDTELNFGTGNIGGLDRFDIMANPKGPSNDLAWPGHVGAWTRLELGWIEPTEITEDGTYELRPVELFPDMYIIKAGFAPKEYLLLENRQPIVGDFDEKFFSPGGVLIYHVDENIWDIFESDTVEGNYPRGYPGQDGWPGNGRHYPVALLQADGLYELDQGINGGQSADIWNQPSQVLGPGNGEKIFFAGDYPNTDSYAFGDIKPTGITIRFFQTKGDTMTFEVCGLTEECEDKPIPPVNDIELDEAIEELVNGSCDTAADAIRPNNSLTAISNIASGTEGKTCYGDEDRKGVWYTVNAGSVPAGEVIRATTCFSETKLMNKISVFKGNDCAELTCVETDEIACKNGYRGHVVYWEAEPEEDYYLFAHTVENEDEDEDDNADVATLGDASLLLSVVNFPKVINDDCGTALTLPAAAEAIVTGTTVGARPESDLPSSETCGIESAGVWFKVVGTGSNMKATTCMPGTDHPTQVHVFAGSCDSLSCISVEANNYAVCSDFAIATNTATVNWETEEGAEYFILVGSRDGSVGNFELKVTEFEPIPTDTCETAYKLFTGDELLPVTGSTEDATNDFPYGEEYCGLPLDTAGVWYTIVGTGGGLSVSTCGFNNYNSAISIFTGSGCGELECVTGVATRDPSCNFAGVTAAWPSEEDVTYYIYVHGVPQNSYGNFEIQVESFEMEVNNGFCNDANLLSGLGVYVEASTLTATHSAPTNICDVELLNPGLWYYFVGTGHRFYISACPTDDMDITVTIFSGSNCGELSCLIGSTFTETDCVSAPWANDVRFLSPMGRTSNYTYVFAEEGEIYYLFVSGKDASPSNNINDIITTVGAFDLTWLSTEEPADSPTVAPSDSPTESPEDSSNKKLLYLLLGVAIFLLLFCVLPLLWLMCKKERSTKDRDRDMEEAAPFRNKTNSDTALFRDESSHSYDDAGAVVPHAREKMKKKKKGRKDQKEKGKKVIDKREKGKKGKDKRGIGENDRDKKGRKHSRERGKRDKRRSKQGQQEALLKAPADDDADPVHMFKKKPKKGQKEASLNASADDDSDPFRMSFQSKLESFESGSFHNTKSSLV